MHDSFYNYLHSGMLMESAVIIMRDSLELTVQTGDIAQYEKDWTYDTTKCEQTFYANLEYIKKNQGDWSIIVAESPQHFTPLLHEPLVAFAGPPTGQELIEPKYLRSTDKRQSMVGEVNSSEEPGALTSPQPPYPYAPTR